MSVFCDYYFFVVHVSAAGTMVSEVLRQDSILFVEDSHNQGIWNALLTLFGMFRLIDALYFNVYCKISMSTNVV